MEYKFNFDGKDFILNEDNCEGIFFGDEEISGIDFDLILTALKNSDEVNFSKEYYTGRCECGKQEQLNKSYCYLEYHFYIYTKDSNYVINTICKEYENTSFNKLFSVGKVDNSYIVNVTVCPCCGKFSIEIDQCEV